MVTIRRCPCDRAHSLSEGPLIGALHHAAAVNSTDGNVEPWPPGLSSAGRGGAMAESLSAESNSKITKKYQYVICVILK